MNKILTITGHKHPKKDKLFWDLAKHKDIQVVKPYTDRELPLNAETIHYEEYHYVLPAVMEDLRRDEKVLAETFVNGHRYVFFEFQMTAKLNVLFADDYAVISIKDKYDNVFTLKLVSELDDDEKHHSDRVGEYLYNHEFDALCDLDDELDYDSTLKMITEWLR